MTRSDGREMATGFTEHEVRPEPGTTLHLRNEEYRFGVGPIICRVKEVVAPVLFDGVPWWHIRGSCANGTAENHGGFTDRELYVISSAVPAQPKTIRQSAPGD